MKKIADTCSVTECKEKYKGLGFCSKHYQRFKKRGTIEGFAHRENHSLSDTPEYEVWTGMKKRCYNKNTGQYADYGGRGIIVCDKWRESFLAFLADVGARPSPKHSIDRINNDGNYEPENVHWATDSEQASNKRTPRHYFIKKPKTTTGYRGVYPYKTHWVAKLSFKEKLLHLGSYATPEEAAKAYDEGVLKYYADTSVLNFPT